MYSRSTTLEVNLESSVSAEKLFETRGPRTHCLVVRAVAPEQQDVLGSVPGLFKCFFYPQVEKIKFVRITCQNKIVG